MPRNKRHTKEWFPLTEQDFIYNMNNGNFVEEEHKAFVTLLYHTGIRISEGLRSIREQFKLTPTKIYFDVGQRLKHGLHTPPLPIIKEKPFFEILYTIINKTEKGNRVFPYCRKTGYNIIDRAFDTYPHYFRLTKITMLFRKGFTIDQVRSWTGHKSLNSLNPYVGFSNVEKMAEA